MNRVDFPAPARRPRSARGQISVIAIGIVVVVVALGVTGLLLRSGSAADQRSGQVDTFSVRSGGFDITLPVNGELAALKQIEIRNSLDSRAIITEIVPEGTFVNAGDVVMRLNDEDVRNRLRDAQDRVNVADATLITAEARLEIQIKSRDLAVELADLALQAWQEGEAKTRLEELKLAVETTEKEYDRLKDRYEQSQQLVEKDFISRDELRRDEISMLKADFELAKARNELMVYENYQREQDRKKKESDLDQARIEREAEVRSARSDVDSKQFQLDSAKEKLAELQQQLAFCTVTAPAPGLIVYFASTQTGGMGRNEGRPPQVGTELSRNELVIILPDTSQMVANVKVSEALVGQIQPGQRATVTCDAIPDQAIPGVVQSVGVLAESGGWRDPNRRDYTVRILLHNGAELGLKPSMRCKANIHVGRVSDAMYIPIQAVFRAGPLAYVYVPQGGGFAQRRVTTGRASELYIEVIDGLNEREIVMLRAPQPEQIVSRLPMPKQEERAANGEEPMPEAPMISPPGMPGMADGREGRGVGNGNGAGAPQMIPGAGNGQRPEGPRRGNRGPRPEGGG